MRLRLPWKVVGIGAGFAACTGQSFQATPPAEGDGGEAAAAGQAPNVPGEPGGGGADDVGGAAGAGAGAGGEPSAPEAGAGGDGGGGAAGASGSAGAPGSEPDYTVTELLDDMEDGDSELLTMNGDWYVLRDMTAGAVITPPFGVPFTMTDLMPARGKSQRAAQISVQGFNGWGASVGFDFRYVNQERVEYDLGSAKGVHFWARASKPTELKLQLPNVDSDPYGNRCGGTEGPNACYDHFTKAFSVGTEWTEVTIPFSALKQAGTGRRAESFDSHRVFSVFFGIGPKQDVTYAIDDVSLVE